MALNCPESKDVLDFQFKIQGKFEVFKKLDQELKSNVNLLAVASNHGLLFAGSICAPEFKGLLSMKLKRKYLQFRFFLSSTTQEPCQFSRNQ